MPREAQLRHVVTALLAFERTTPGHRAHRDDVVDSETGLLREVCSKADDDATTFMSKGELLFEPRWLILVCQQVTVGTTDTCCNEFNKAACCVGSRNGYLLPYLFPLGELVFQVRLTLYV